LSRVLKDINFACDMMPHWGESLLLLLLLRLRLSVWMAMSLFFVMARELVDGSRGKGGLCFDSEALPSQQALLFSSPAQSEIHNHGR
jgi:hypothetical protein